MATSAVQTIVARQSSTLRARALKKWLKRQGYSPSVSQRGPDELVVRVPEDEGPAAYRQWQDLKRGDIDGSQLRLIYEVLFLEERLGSLRDASELVFGSERNACARASDLVVEAQEKLAEAKRELS